MSEKELKVVFTGESSIRDEKICLLMVLNGKSHPEKYVPSLFENNTQEVIIEGNLIKFHVWDTAGQDEYDRLRPLSYSGCNCVALSFKLTDRNSFFQIEEKWYKEVKKYCKDAALILVGLCLDERESGNSNHVSDAEANQMVVDLNLSAFIACSAKTGEGVDKVFPAIAKACLSRSKHKGSCIIS